MNMNLGITVIVLYLVPIAWGQILNQSGDTLQVHSKTLLDLEFRLYVVERLRNEDALRIADFSKKQQTDQRRIADLEKQQQADHRLLSDFTNKRDEDSRTLADLEQMHQDDHVRIADLEKKRQDDQQRIADLEEKRQNDHVRIADLERKRQDDQKRVADLEKRQCGYMGRIADLEKNLRDGEKRLLTYPDKQERRRKLDSYHKFPFDSITNSTARTIDVTRLPSVRKTNSFKPNPSHALLPSPTLEISNQRLIQKRVSSNNQGMVAFYAVLTQTINPISLNMEIRFDRVITNIGGSYSGNTGTFMCTKAGVYVFSWAVQVSPRYLYTELVKNGAMIGSTLSGDTQWSGMGRGTAVVQLDQGDVVWVRVEHYHTASYIYVEGHRQATTFSGFLLQ